MIFNLGSINADYFYAVPHLPQPGETLVATMLTSGLGGKGANMSVAAVQAGSDVRHIGAVGADGAWAVQVLRTYGVDTTHIATVDLPTAHAIINVDAAGENAIVIFSGANAAQSERGIDAALQDARPDDTFVLQNETNCQVEAAKLAREKGLRVAYAAAPFEAHAVHAILEHVDVLFLNEIEMQQLQQSMGQSVQNLQVDLVCVTKGAPGGMVYSKSVDGRPVSYAAPIVDVVDTTGAGDTFTGFLLAGLDQSLPLEAAIERAAAAAALQVTKKGTAEAIPSLDEVLTFLG